MVEQSAVLNQPFGRSAHWFTLLYIYTFFLANTFLPLFGVTVLAVFYVLAYLVSSGLRFPKDMTKYLVIPAVLLVIGFSGSADNDRYDVFKDAWYYVNSAIVLSAGYLMMRRTGRIEPLLKVFVIGGFLLALYHLSKIAANPWLLFETTIGQYRKETGAGYFLTFLSPSILIFSGRYGIEVFTSKHRKFFVPVIIYVTAASLVLSFSRTMWGAFFIIVFVMAGLFTLRRAKAILAGVVILTLIMTFSSVMSAGGRTTGTILGKLANSLDEVALSDYTSIGDINRNWRGYESHRAMKTYLDGNAWNLAVGHGFGKLVDLKIFMLLGKEELRYIPIMHNGYMYVLVKTGVIGLALYLRYLYLFYKKGSAISASEDSKDVFAGRMIVSLVIVLVFTTFVISGYFNKGALVPVMLLLGHLLCYARMRMIEGGKL
ncbi:MAG: O-antigen ligase family protein [Thermodesulfobacteriota bacterium]